MENLLKQIVNNKEQKRSFSVVASDNKTRFKTWFKPAIQLTINSILVNIDIISGSYVNGSTQPTIYSFFSDVSPGYKIIENPHNLLYLTITSDTIHSITIWLTDNNRNELNLRGENLSMRFHLREI